MPNEIRTRAVVCLFAVVALRGVAACVDGVTPDCSNPAVCAPIEGDAAPLSTDSGSDSAASTDSAPTFDAPTSQPDAADAASDG